MIKLTALPNSVSLYSFSVKCWWQTTSCFPGVHNDLVLREVSLIATLHFIWSSGSDGNLWPPLSEHPDTQQRVGIIHTIKNAGDNNLLIKQACGLLTVIYLDAWFKAFIYPPLIQQRHPAVNDANVRAVRILQHTTPIVTWGIRL